MRIVSSKITTPKWYGLQVKNYKTANFAVSNYNPMPFRAILPASPFINKYSLPSTQKSVGFGGITWKLPEIDIDDADDAIKAYSYLKLGNYLDSNDDDVCLDNKQIRKSNLAFLDELTTVGDKAQFIEYYKKLTGFPDLAKVSINIENEFVGAINKSEQELGRPEYECLGAGYDETCSVGKRLAFPGSDLDKSFIILRGTNSDKKNEAIIRNFRTTLWNNTDQRLLSYNHDTSFPSVYTVKQIKILLNKIEEQAKSINIHKKPMERLMTTEYNDIESASLYNVLMSQRFPARTTKEDIHNPDKETVKNFGYFIESVRESKKVIRTKDFDKLIDEVKDYQFFKYSNVGQMQAMKNAVKSGKENKTKIKKRQELCKNFDKLSISKQYDFIKELIRYSCEDNEDEEYSVYFKNDSDIKAKYRPLLGVLTKGDRNRYHKPQFSEIQDGLRMHYSDSDYVDLYHGMNNHSLWIESDDSEKIKEVLRHFDRIKLSPKFQDITSVQCPKPKENITGFKAINNFDSEGNRIYERVME